MTATTTETAAIATATNVTIDAEGNVVLPAKALRALRPDGERLTLLDIEISVEHGTLVLRRSTIDEEDWWAYTPENLAAVERARATPPDQDLHLSQRDLERMVGLDSE